MRTLSPQLRKVADGSDYVGESPQWSQAQEALYWVSCEHPSVLQRWHPSSGERRSWPVPQRIGGFVLKRSGGALVALADGIYDMDLATGALTRRVGSQMAHASLHECRCDRPGRFWVGAIDRRVGPDNLLPSGGSLFRLQGGRLVAIAEGISCSNGLAFSPDGTTLYHTDSPTRIVNAWTLDPGTGAVSRKREFVRLAPEEGFCDGATVDAEGGYWMALVFTGRLRRYLPDGTLDLEVELPFSNPTSLAFGGPEYRTLFITTTRMSIGTPLRGEPMHGSVYALDAPCHGIAEPLLKD